MTTPDELAEAIRNFREALDEDDVYFLLDIGESMELVYEAARKWHELKAVYDPDLKRNLEWVQLLASQPGKPEKRLSDIFEFTKEAIKQLGHEHEKGVRE